MASSSSASRKRRPSWFEREIVFESTVNLEELRSHAMARTAVQIIESSFLTPLMYPAAVAYPRLVRLFYQNFALNTDENEEQRASIDIDGFHASFTVKDLAAALGLAGYDHRPVNRVDAPDDFTMVRDLIEDRGPGTVVKRALLHPSMWLFDHIFVRNLCPVGHAQERRPPVLQYMHAAYKGYFVDAAELILTTMVRINRDGRATPFALPYPRFITTILGSLGYIPSPTEEVVTQFETFGMESWDLSLKSLKRSSRFEEPDAPPAQQRQPQRGPAAEPSFQWTQQMYDDLMAQQATIIQQQTTILQQQEYISSDMYSLRQDFYEQQSIVESVAGMSLDPASARRVFERARQARGRARPRGYQPPEEL